MSACLPACFPTRLPSCLPACLPALPLGSCRPPPILTASLPPPPYLQVQLQLNGTRGSADLTVGSRSDPSGPLNLGSKVLAAYYGGRIDLHGAPVPNRWLRLSAPALAGSSILVVDGLMLGWSAGMRVAIASSSYNPDAVDVVLIKSVDAGTGGQGSRALKGRLKGFVA